MRATSIIRHLQLTIFRTVTRLSSTNLAQERNFRRLLRLFLRRKRNRNIKQDSNINVLGRIARLKVTVLTGQNIRKGQLTPMLLRFLRLLGQRIRLTNRLIQHEFAPRVLRRLTLCAKRLISRFGRIRERTGNTNLVNRNANSNLAGPPHNMNKRLRTLLPIRLLSNAGRAGITFLSRVGRRRTTAHMTLNRQSRGS